MAYQSQVNARDKAGAVAAVVAIHAALLLAFMNLAGKMAEPLPQAVLQIFDLPKPAPPPPPPRPHLPKPKQKSGGAAPRNLKSQATPVAAPEPQMRIPRVQHIAASVTPRAGVAPTQGASDLPGPGTGAGGAGNGTGSGAGGSGSGAGGGGVAEPPHLASPVLRGNDFPGELLEQWPRGATVFMRLRIDARGYVAECMIDRGSGVPVIDASLCNIVHDRLRFRPALDRSGQAVAGWFGYAQPAPR